MQFILMQDRSCSQFILLELRVGFSSLTTCYNIGGFLPYAVCTGVARTGDFVLCNL